MLINSECEHCGPVWLEEEASDYVLGCPWCHYAVKGIEIPRPVASGKQVAV